MLLLLLWLIIEVTEALEELKKLLQTINNSKYASCNYCNIINILLSYYADQTGAGRGVDVDGGVDGAVEEEGEDTITILFLSSIYIIIMYIVHLLYYFIIYLLIIYLFTLVLKSETRCLLQGKPYKFSQQTSTLRTGKYPKYKSLP